MPDIIGFSLIDESAELISFEISGSPDFVKMILKLFEFFDFGFKIIVFFSFTLYNSFAGLEFLGSDLFLLFNELGDLLLIFELPFLEILEFRFG